MKKGLIDRFRSLPMARSAVLAGRTLADVVVNLFGVIIVIAVGYVVGFRFSTSVPEVLYGDRPAAAVRLRVQLDLRARRFVFSTAESAQQIGFTAIFPLTFISSAFVPIENMPAPLEAFAEVNPFTITVDAMRHLFVGTPAGNSVWGATLWSIGLTIVFAPLAVPKYRSVSSR